MRYSFFFEKKAENQLKKIDITQQRFIVNWIFKNLQTSKEP